jgi:hypothetical protein
LAANGTPNRTPIRTQNCTCRRTLSQHRVVCKLDFTLPRIIHPPFFLAKFQERPYPCTSPIIDQNVLPVGKASASLLLLLICSQRPRRKLEFIIHRQKCSRAQSTSQLVSQSVSHLRHENHINNESRSSWTLFIVGEHLNGRPLKLYLN